MAAQTAVDAFFELMRSLEHAPRQVRTVPGHAVVVGKVRYARHDDCDVALPFVDALALADDRIAALCVRVDGAPIPHPAP